MGQTDPEMPQPRILLVAYGFPPAGGGGVQRPSKMVKVWTRRGAEVCVLSGPVGAAAAQDPSLLDDLPGGMECVRAADPSPWLALQRLRKGLPQGGAWRLLDRLLVALSVVARAISVPDHRCGWLLAAVPKGWLLARRFRPTAIVATGPPFTSFLVGRILASVLRLPLVLDYRDPWTATYLPNQSTWLAGRLNPYLERWSLENAAGVVAAHRAVFQFFGQLGPGGRTLCRRRLFAPNGYDADDFADGLSPATDRFTISYTGSFYGFRNPRVFLEVLEELLQSGRLDPSRFRFLVAGVSGDALRATHRDRCLAAVLESEGYLPHAVSVRRLVQSTVNLVIEGETGGRNRHSPGKFYEVLRAARPVLLLCPEGTTPWLARRVGGCRVAHPEDRQAIRQAVIDYYDAWERGDTDPIPDGETLRFYDRVHQADRFLRFLLDVTPKR